MEINKIILAPATTSAGELFAAWQESHVGNMDDFFAFLTTPSVARTAFLFDENIGHTSVGIFITTDITPDS